MGCEILSGITGVCGYDASGVEKLWIGNRSSITGLTQYNACGEVTGITFENGTVQIFEIEAALDSITYTDDLQVNGPRRNILQTINFSVTNMDCNIIDTLETIGLSNMFAICKLADGSYKLFGDRGTGLRATVVSEVSGTASANDGAVTVTISGISLAKARIIDPTYAASIGLT